MNKYFAFSTMLAFLENHAEVLDANMNHYNGIMVKGVDDDSIIEITVSIKSKGDKADD